MDADRRVRPFEVKLEDRAIVVEATSTSLAVLEARRRYAQDVPDWRWRRPALLGVRELEEGSRTR